jgi:hypothetical protein
MKGIALKGLALLAPLACIYCTTDPVDPGKLDPSKLAPPASGQGFQMKSGGIQVSPGDEVQACFFYKVSDLAAAGGLPANQPVNLHRVQIAQREGSHHLNIFRVKTIKNLDPAKGTVIGVNGGTECFKSPNWSDWPLVANTQKDGEVDWTYPEGVANEFLPDEWLMVQSHYVNASSQKTPAGFGEVAINFHTIPKDQVKHQMGTLFATKQNIRICQKNPTPSYSGTCQFKSTQPVNIIGANAHFHSRGKSFDMFSWDGKTETAPPESARFYTSKSWDEPPMLRSPELNVQVPANGGVFYTCGFEWKQPEPSVGCQGLNDYDRTANPPTKEEDLDCCYRFGPIVEKNEHCNIFVYYYPRLENASDVNCF